MGPDDTVDNLSSAWSEDPELRKQAALSRGDVPSMKAIQVLIRLLEDSSIAVRVAAARSLGKSGDRRAVEPLLQVHGSSNHEFRQAISESLLELGAKCDIVPDLLPRTKSANAYARKSAIWVLGNLRDSRAFLVACEALHDHEGYVRSAAAYALGKFSDNRAIPLLLTAARSDPEEAVRLAAKASLINLGYSSATIVSASLGDLDLSDGLYDGGTIASYEPGPLSAHTISELKPELLLPKDDGGTIADGVASLQGRPLPGTADPGQVPRYDFRKWSLSGWSWLRLQMNIKCTFGFHKWQGCRCSACGRTRDVDMFESGHDWRPDSHSKDWEKCSKCGKQRQIPRSQGMVAQIGPDPSERFKPIFETVLSGRSLRNPGWDALDEPSRQRPYPLSQIGKWIWSRWSWLRHHGTTAVHQRGGRI